MDEDEEYLDERDEVLDRFRKELEKPMADRFFDEDDLIEAFDYAGDLNDDYLRMEALMCGARFYPDSEALLERRGIFYSQYSEDARRQFLGHNPAQGNLILEFLSVKDASLSEDERKSRIEKLIDDYDQLSDEEVIQLVDLASSLGLYHWLKGKMEALRKKAQYINILLYEMAVAADLNGDHEYSATLLEEITDNEPFNSYYWMMLAKQLAALNKPDKALSAIDYSLAINPDAPDAVNVKAHIYYMMGKPLREVIDMLVESINSGNGSIANIKFLASIYNDEDMQGAARQILETALESYPDYAVDIIPDLLTYGPDNVDELLDRFYDASDDKSQVVWASWAQQFSMQGRPDLAKAAIRCYERRSGQEIPSPFTAEDSFISQDFAGCLDNLEDFVKQAAVSEQTFPGVVAMHAVSLAKTGQTAKALTLCRYYLQRLDIASYPTVSGRLEYFGLMALLHDVAAKLESGHADWDSYDPLRLWEK